MSRICSLNVTKGICACIIVSILVPIAAFAGDERSVPDVIAEAVPIYLSGQLDECLSMIDEVFTAKELNPEDVAALYSLRSMVEFAKGSGHHKASFTCLDNIVDTGPCLIDLPFFLWPPQLKQEWYKRVNQVGKLHCPAEESDIRIAVLDFDDQVVKKDEHGLGSFPAGLADLFQNSLAKIDDFKVLERDKTQFIINEHELFGNDMATLVKIGKLLKARYMVFGGITGYDVDKSVFHIRVIDVESTETLQSAQREGDLEDHFNNLNALVLETAESLKVTLSEAKVDEINGCGTDNRAAIDAYLQGLAFSEKFDYPKAFEYFKQAYEADGAFAEAKFKMDLYKPLASTS